MLSYLQRGGVSLVLLSVVLPCQGNSAMLATMERYSAIPVVIVSTGKAARGGMSLLHLNTSSCVAGPFSVRRILTEVRDGLHQIRFRGSGPARLHRNSLILSLGSGATFLRNDRLALATGRFTVLRLLVGCPSGVFSGTGLFRDI